MAKTTQQQPSSGREDSATGEKGIRAKYGGKLAKAINRAIRAEVAGGNEALDKLTQLAGPALHSHWKDKAGRDTPEAAAYFKHQKEVVSRMEADVRRRWGIPPDKPKDRPTGKPKGRSNSKPAGKREGKPSGKPQGKRKERGGK